MDTGESQLIGDKMKVEQDKTVVIEYTLTDDNGNIIDSTKGQQPLSYVHGVGQLIPGLEKELNDKVAGDNIKVTVAPAEAYGERDENAIQEIPRAEFKGVDKIEPGMQFHSHGHNGQHQIVTVTKVADDTITVDTNHPLAGANLNFEVTIVEVKETEAHSCCGGNGSSCSNDKHSQDDSSCGCDSESKNEHEEEFDDDFSDEHANSCSCGN